MKSSIPLIFTGSLVILGIIVYTLLSDTVINADNSSSLVEASDTKHVTFEEGGWTANDIATILREFAVLRSELATLKTLTPTIQRLNLEVSELKVKLALLSNQSSNSKNDDTTYNGTDDLDNQVNLQPDSVGNISTFSKEQQEKDDERVDIIKNAFQSQDTDEQWSADVTDTITGVFTDKSFSESTLSQVQCRSTLCIVEVEHHDSSAVDEFDMEFQRQIGSQLPQTNYTSTQNDDGSVTVTMYMAREGYEFPQVEQ